MEPQALRDLRWVIESPSLLDGEHVVPSVEFDSADLDVNQLQAFLAERASHRVGRYFENLISFWLTHIRKVNIVAQGYQIQDGTRTVGEVDFLFHDEHGRLNHCEAAVKFFLHHPREGTSHYPGPNARDNFEKKVAKLFDKQLRISETYFPDVEVRAAYVRGMMFYHPSVGESATAPERLSPSHFRGAWIRSAELSWLSDFDGCRGAILNKPLWLSHPDEDQCVPLNGLIEQLEQHFASSDFPVMVSLMGSETTELQRLFVVPESWPVVRK